MRTIKNMPDNFVGGVAKLLLGKGPTRETPTAFLDVTPIHLEVNHKETTTHNLCINK